MQYKKFKPALSLTPYVECYYRWEGTAAESLTVQSPPNGFPAIVFNIGAPYFSSQESDTLAAVPRAFVSGQFTSNYRLHLHGPIDNVGVVLKPATVHNFFGIRMSQLVNARAPLDFLPGVDANSIWQTVRDARTQPEQVAIFDAFLTPYIQAAKAHLSIIDEAIDYIDRCKGCITVDAVATHLKISRRYLEKKFLEKVGISPKFYARVKRFSVLSNEIAHSARIDWQHIVHQYGFYDQSHLVKEFLEFNQMNPTQYHLLHQEMTRFVK
jgi:AraC-like DNA-binding protein